MRFSFLSFLFGVFISLIIFYFVNKKNYTDSVYILTNNQYFVLKKDMNIGNFGKLKKGSVLKKIATFSEGYSSYVLFLNTFKDKEIFKDTIFKKEFLYYPYGLHDK